MRLANHNIMGRDLLLGFIQEEICYPGSLLGYRALHIKLLKKKHRLCVRR